VEVGDTRLGRVRDVLEVASSISLRVSVTHLSSGMERLMHITCVVDDKTEGERLLISHSGEVALNLLVVGGVFVVVPVH